MTYSDECIIRMTVAEFKAFKRAVQVLCRMGLNYSKAVDILIAARNEELINRERFKSCG